MALQQQRLGSSHDEFALASLSIGAVVESFSCGDPASPKDFLRPDSQWPWKELCFAGPSPTGDKEGSRQFENRRAKTRVGLTWQKYLFKSKVGEI